jgi:RND family efflux transporter MFP subunit
MVLDTARMDEALRKAASAYYTAEEDLARTTKRRDADIEAAQLAHKEAQAALEQYRQELKTDLDAKRQQIAFDEAALGRAKERIERLRRLATQGLITRREVEAAESDIKSKEFALEKQVKDLQLAEAKGAKDEIEKNAQVDKVAADLERARSRREDEIENAKGTLEILKRRLDRAAEDVEKSEIYAPTDGIVILDEEHEGGRHRPLEAGDRIWPRRRIARIPDLSTMRVYVPLPQERASDVEVGQKVEVTPDALRGKVFRGEVSYVATTAIEETARWMPTGERFFKAYIALDEVDAGDLKPGMRANVRIIVDSYQDVLSVPLECVFEREGRKKVVYVRRGGKFLATPVVIGRANQNRVIITKGLKDDEAVALRDLGRPAVDTTDVGDEAAPEGPAL